LQGSAATVFAVFASQVNTENLDEMILHGAHCRYGACCCCDGRHAAGSRINVAAFFGAFMNWNYLMAGSVSTNSLLIGRGGAAFRGLEK
jgi:hypothetical protein